MGPLNEPLGLSGSHGATRRRQEYRWRGRVHEVIPSMTRIIPGGKALVLSWRTTLSQCKKGGSCSVGFFSNG